MPRPAKNLKLEQRIEVARRFAAGESARELAAAFGISPRHVNRLAKEEAGEGIAVRDPSEAVAFRASRSELDAFDAEWRERGYANRSQALNAVLRGRCGFLDVPRDLVEEFCAVWRQAKDVSDAGLVLAKAVHRGRLEVSEADRAVLIELLDLARSMSREMGQMKDAAQALRHQEWPQKEEGQGTESAVLEDGQRTIERGLRLVRNG
ncbi:helix-turn-helix domain-containing protein [Phaeobacter italicus]|uniref:helix-turn-helix domain-containing protein n=1 Tax=Phaeobacter italicus TaxID=481446 RepID=UPI001ADA653E|nr:helix-turn-helix domain-containing protein [Phaeobacter italicus]